jgi:hypothetical protein
MSYPPNRFARSGTVWGASFGLVIGFLWAPKIQYRLGRICNFDRYGAVAGLSIVAIVTILGAWIGWQNGRRRKW